MKHLIMYDQNSERVNLKYLIDRICVVEEILRLIWCEPILVRERF